MLKKLPYVAPTILPLDPANDGRVELMRAKWTSPRPHRHAELELNVMVRGRGEYVVNDRIYTLRPGTIAWLFLEHSHLLFNQSDDFEMWVAVFRPRLLKRICTAPDMRVLRTANPPENFCKVLSVDAFRHLDGLCRYVAEAEPDAPRNNAGLGFLLLEAWRAFQKCDGTLAGTTLHPAVERTAQLLGGEGAEWDFERLARAAGLSASRLGRLFKEQTGASVVDYRNQLRVQRFIDLFGSGQRITMLHAALQAGFGSYTQFHRVFARVAGFSPRAYYRKLKENRYVSLGQSISKSSQSRSRSVS